MLPPNSASNRDDEPLPALLPQSPVLIRLFGALTTDAGPEELAGWVLGDPALAARAILAQPDQPPAQALGAAGIRSWLPAAAIDALHTPDRPWSAHAWSDALGCACLCRVLARRLGYPDAQEAYLAGLFHNLDRLTPQADQQAPPDFHRIAGWLAGLRLAPYLVDAIRIQAEDTHRLAEALPLARLLRVARSARTGAGDTRLLAASLLPDLGEETLGDLLHEADAEAAGLAQALAAANASRSEQARLSSALQQFLLLDQVQHALAGAHGEAGWLDRALNILARSIRIEAPIYLVHDAQDDALRPHPDCRHAPLGLRVRLPNSNAAAAWAWNSREPVVFSTRDTESVSLLDSQLAALAQRDAVLAIPVGENAMTGILIGCVAHAEVPHLERSIDFLGRLGRLFGQALSAHQAHRQAPDSLGEYKDRIRRAAHEINNPLGIAKNYLAILGAKLGSGNPVAEELAIIRQELNRIPRILDGLAEGRPDAPLKSENCDINALFRELGIVAESAIPPGKQVRVTLRTAASAPVIDTDPEKLKQLLLNLILNALEAVPAEGGEVGIEAYTSVDHQNQKRLSIELRNNGQGIPAERMDHLFEPQASSKPGQHAGLGLAIVKTLADELGMTVACRSGDQGTLFQIAVTLP